MSQRDEINKDKGSRGGESTGRDNVQLYLGIMSGYVSYDLHGEPVEEKRRDGIGLDDLRGSRSGKIAEGLPWNGAWWFRILPRTENNCFPFKNRIGERELRFYVSHSI